MKNFKPFKTLKKHPKSHVLTNGLIFIYKGQDPKAICSSFRVVNEELPNEGAEKQHKQSPELA